MHALPEEFGCVGRLALLGFIAEGDNALHWEFLGNAEQLGDLFGGRLAIGAVTVSHLYPAAAQSQISGLKLHI